jgi:hypothetical protein
MFSLFSFETLGNVCITTIMTHSLSFVPGVSVNESRLLNWLFQVKTLIKCIFDVPFHYLKKKTHQGWNDANYKSTRTYCNIQVCSEDQG